MAAKLSKKELAQFREVFDLFDEDKNGTIELHELEKMVNRIQQRAISKKDLLKLMNSVDKDHSGAIDFDEFVLLMTTQLRDAKHDPDAEIRLAFDQFDMDKSGTIDKHEIAVLFSRLGIVADSSQIEDVIALVDKDGNGVIDFEEFKEMYEMLGMRGKPLGKAPAKKGPAAATTNNVTANAAAAISSAKGKCCVIS